MQNVAAIKAVAYLALFMRLLYAHDWWLFAWHRGSQQYATISSCRPFCLSRAGYHRCSITDSDGDIFAALPDASGKGG